jgi:hypothetical protein
MQTDKKESHAGVNFEPNEFYENLLAQRRADKVRFEMSYSPATQHSVELYEAAKAKHKERGNL